MSELGISTVQLFIAAMVYVAGSVVAGIAGLEFFHRVVKPFIEGFHQ